MTDKDLDSLLSNAATAKSCNEFRNCSAALKKLNLTHLLSDVTSVKIFGILSKRLETDPGYLQHAFLLLKILLSASSKTVKLSNAPWLIQFCLTHICCLKSCGKIVVFEDAAEILANLHSYDSQSAWCARFVQYINACRAITVNQLGLEPSTIPVTKTSATIPFPPLCILKSTLSDITVDATYGTRKAMRVLRAFEGYCMIIRKMLSHGCQTSAVPIMMPEWLELCNVIFHQVLTPSRISTRNTKNHIQNEKGNLTVVDISTIAYGLKVQCMSVLDILLNQPHPYLFKVADVMSRYLYQCMVEEVPAEGTELLEYQSLFAVTVSTWLKYINVYPATMIMKKNTQELVRFIINQFQHVMRRELVHVTSNTVTTAGTSAEQLDTTLNQLLKYSYVCTTNSLQLVVFQLIQSVLLKYGVLLLHKDRAAIQSEIWIGLSALNKGVMVVSRPPAFATAAAGQEAGVGSGGQVDRKAVHRCQRVEGIRGSIVFQLQLIRLATTELLVPVCNHPSRNTSILYTNSNVISLLRSVCRTCKMSVPMMGYGGGMSTTQLELQSQISYTELYIDTLLHPSIVAMPCHSISHLSQEFLSNQTLTGNTTSNNPNSNPAGVNVSEGLTEMEIGSSSDVYSVQYHTNASVHGGNTTTAIPPPAAPPAVTSMLLPIISNPSHGSTTSTYELDEDEFPDINIE